MANVKENVQEVQEVKANEAVKENAIETGFELTREEFEGRDKKKYWSYAIHGKVRGRDVKVDFVAYDQGGYEVLDIIFDVKPTAELVITDGSMTNQDTGEVVNFRTYEARNVDPDDGIEYRYKIKLARESDKALLNMLLQQKQHAQA